MTRSDPARSSVRAAACAVLLAAAGLAGCMAAESAPGLLDDQERERRGQTVLFLGTDPTTLRTDIYLARAVSQESDLEGDEEPEVSEATEFEVFAVTELDVGGQNALQSDTDTLFSEEVPFPVPDLAGGRVAILATTRDAGGAPVGGRVQLLDLESGSSLLGGEVPGLFAVHFTWNASFLVLERRLPDDAARTEILVQGPAQLGKQGPVPLGPEGPGLSVEFAGHVRDSDRILAVVRDVLAGTSDVWMLDPEAGTAFPLTDHADLADRVDHPAMSPDGRWLAVARTRPDPGNRAMVVIDTANPDMAPLVLSDDLAFDCRWPAWSSEAEAPQLAFSCVAMGTERPDLLRWLPAEPGTVEVLTTGPQDILDGTMEGLVLRAAPIWDPRGEFMVFGASRPEDAEEGIGMTLAVLPPGQSAFQVWSGDEGSGGWAHFSSATRNRNLLLWDRAVSGLEDSQGLHPIQIVLTDAPDQATRPVVLGTDLAVAYPLLLGWNTLLYP